MIFTTAFSAVFPLFAKIAIGFGIRQARLLSAQTFDELNRLVFKLFLPALLFANIYRIEFSSIERTSLLWYSIIAVLGVFGIFFLIVPILISDNRQRGVVIQGICRSNFVLFGIPMATNLYGGVSAAFASLLGGLVVPFYNVLSVIVLEYFRGKKPDYRKIGTGIVTNPIILGALLGAGFSLLQIKIPYLIEQILFEISAITAPLALIVLGGSVTYSTVRTNTKALVFAVLGRLVLVPAIGLAVSIAVGYRNLELILLMSMFASPTAVSSYTMSQQMDGDADLAGQIVVFTTLFSLITLFLWISTLMAFGYF